MGSSTKGKKVNNAMVFNGGSFQDLIDLSYAEASAFRWVLPLNTPNGVVYLMCYDGSTGFNETTYTDIPKGSVVFDLQDATIKMVSDDNTFVETAALT